jgi:uncharacterized protein (TIGR03437 family)
VIASAQPGVFAQKDGSGVVFDVKPGATAQILVDADHPMSAGDAIVIYCAGLGPVTPAIAAGSAAPSSPSATTTNPATVTIGGQSPGFLQRPGGRIRRPLSGECLRT